jgi:hypothetical protein
MAGHRSDTGNSGGWAERDIWRKSSAPHNKPLPRLFGLSHRAGLFLPTCWKSMQAIGRLGWLALSTQLYSAGMPNAAPHAFRCPNCAAEYKVVRIEALPTHDKRLTCLSCGAPLRNRAGKFALKYFRVSYGGEPGSRRNRRVQNF